MKFYPLFSRMYHLPILCYSAYALLEVRMDYPQIVDAAIDI